MTKMLTVPACLQQAAGHGIWDLECFQEKWIPVFRPETRQNNILGSGFDSIKTGRTREICDL